MADNPLDIPLNTGISLTDAMPNKIIEDANSSMPCSESKIAKKTITTIKRSIINSIIYLGIIDISDALMPASAPFFV